MIHIIWEFQVKKRKIKEFENYYSASGKWASLFRRSPDYRETILVRDTENPERYLLTDIWEDIHSFRRFKRDFASEYLSLDQKCMEFTEEERCLGFFESV